MLNVQIWIPTEHYRIAGEVDARLEPIPISVEAYENDTWIPLIYEIKAKGLELKVAF